MSIPLYLMASLFATGLYLNRNGKQSRAVEKPRDQIPEDEMPSGKNTYHSERYYKTWDQVFDESSKSHIRALDPVNENVVPRYWNEMSARQEMSPELQSYVEKRGSRLRFFDEQNGKETFINEGGNEKSIDNSPMFNPLGKNTKSTLNQDEQRDTIENFKVTNRKSVVGGASTKQEHFGMFTMHGPRNSNNPNFHNNMVPFFGSHIYQNTDPEAHQPLLERFTGQTNSATELRSQPKREIPSLQDRMPGQTYIYGTPADNVNLRDRYLASTLRTNVTPVEQVRVGPGISGTYDSKPRDGFHPYYRPPQRNVDELRVNPKNVYGGRLLPGKELVQNRGNIGEVFKRRPDTFYINDPRRWFKTTGSFTGPAIRENFVAYKQNREDTNVAYTGIAGSEGVSAQRPSVYLEGSQEDICGPTSLNAQVKHSDRNQLPNTGPYRNLSGDAMRQQQYLQDEARPTTRQTTHVRDYMGIVGSEGQQRQQQYLQDEARPTTRQTTHVRDYMGIVGSEGQQRQQQYLQDEARPTTRQTTHVRDYMGIVGNEGQQRQQQYLQDEARPTTRQTTHVRDYMGIVGSEGQQRQQKYLYDKARPTTRQTTHVRDYMGIVGSEGQQRQQQYLQDEARPTTRQTTHVRDYMGQVGNEGITRQQQYLYDEARPTTKQTTLIKDYSGIAGNGENQKPRSYEAEYNATTDNRQESLLPGRTYGPNKATGAAIGSCDINVQLKTRTGYDITKYGPNETRQYTAIPNIGDNFQNTTSQNQRDQPGVRQPEDFVVSQFQRNPYTQSLNSAPRQTSAWQRGEIPFDNN